MYMMIEKLKSVSVVVAAVFALLIPTLVPAVATLPTKTLATALVPAQTAT